MEKTVLLLEWLFNYFGASLIGCPIARGSVICFAILNSFCYSCGLLWLRRCFLFFLTKEFLGDFSMECIGSTACLVGASFQEYV